MKLKNSQLHQLLVTLQFDCTKILSGGVQDNRLAAPLIYMLVPLVLLNICETFRERNSSLYLRMRWALSAAQSEQSPQ